MTWVRATLDIGPWKKSRVSSALQAAAEGNLNAISDCAVGATLAYAALTGASYNVKINFAELPEGSTHKQLDTRITELIEEGERINHEVRQVLQQRGGIHLA